LLYGLHRVLSNPLSFLSVTECPETLDLTWQQTLSVNGGGDTAAFSI